MTPSDASGPAARLSGFRELLLEDKPFFDELFKAEDPDISEYTFSNLFVWRRPRGILVRRDAATAVLTAVYEGKYFILPPLGFPDIVSAYRGMFRAFRGDANFGGALKIPERHAAGLREAGFVLEEDRDNFDYLYSTDDLASLKGRHYDGKRGFLRKFYDNYESEFTTYTVRYKEACLKLTREWAARKTPSASPSDVRGFQDEFEAVRDYLDHLAELHCCGCILTVDDKVVAFTFGEQLNHDTFVIHFEKGDTDYSGVYQAVNQQFVRNAVLGRCPFVNREQDMGIEGIRKAKMSYRPVKFVAKYRIPVDKNLSI